MLIVPGEYQGARGLFLGVLFLAALLLGLKRGLKIHSWISGLTILCVATSLIFMTWGSINDAPGSLRVGTVYVIWPLLFIFFIGVFHERGFWQPYLKIVVIGSLMVEIICILIMTDAIGITSIGMIGYIDANVGIFDGMTQLHTQNMGVLLFSVPYLISKIEYPNFGATSSTYWRSIEYITLVGGIIVLFLSGRKALWLVTAMAPLTSFFIGSIVGEKIKLGRVVTLVGIGVLGLIAVQFIHGIEFKVIWDFFASGFNFSDGDTVISESSFRRKEQFSALMSGWESNILFGSGHGAAAADNINLEVDAWAYELQYVALLFQVGVVGIVIYAGSVLWLYWRSFLLMKKDVNFRLIMIPLLTGMTSFLIANSTNPYLAKFDYLWVLFLPLAVLNSFLVHQINSGPNNVVISLPDTVL